MKTRAIKAVFMDLVGQIFALGHGESHSCEKLWDPREKTNTAHFMFFRLGQQCFDQASTAGATLI
jgi:hypothetical protein